jgi:magnesium-transporting ATPase (P-type)
MNGLFTDVKNGIKGDSQDIEDRKINFGDNEPPKAEIKGFLKIFLGALDDFTLKILMVAALVSIAVSVGTNWDTSHRSTSWIEGFAIVVAIFISAMVSSINDYQKEKQFQELNNKADSRKTISVIRNGQSLVIHQSLVLVGDIVEIVEGMEIPADGIILQASEVVSPLSIYALFYY